MALGEANARLLLALSTIGFGYFLRRIGLADVDAGKALLKILFNATLPSVLLLTFATLTFDATSAAVMMCALAQAALLYGVSLAFRDAGRAPKGVAILAGSAVGVNLGTFCYPLVEAVWGAQGLGRVVLFDAVNQWSLLVVAPLIYARAVAGDAFSLRDGLAKVRNQLLSPCLLAMFAAVALRVAGLDLPAPVATFASSLAVANKPLALIALGVLFEPKLELEQIRDVGALLALRYGASFALGGALAASAAALGLAPALVGAVMAALISPVPLLTVTYAVEHECDVGLAAALVNAGNFCSFGLLLAVANADFARPDAAVALTVAGAALCVLGRWLAAGSAPKEDGSSGSIGDGERGPPSRGVAAGATRTTRDAAEAGGATRLGFGGGGSARRRFARVAPSADAARVGRAPMRARGRVGKGGLRAGGGGRAMPAAFPPRVVFG